METHVCPWWLAYTFDNPLRRLLHNPEALFGPWLSQGAAAMDVGCGMGHFSLGMARMVGEKGRVVSVDLQDEMLSIVKKRAENAGLGTRVETVRAEPDGFSVSGPVDFALAFWMAHEVPDQDGFFARIHEILSGGGKFFLAEPRFHVSGADFGQSVDLAIGRGFSLLASPKVRFSRAAVLQKA